MKKLKCIIGFHKWKTLKTGEHKVTAISTLTGKERKDVDAVTVIQECEDCEKQKGYMTDGVSKTKIDLNFVKSKTNHFDDVIR